MSSAKSQITHVFQLGEYDCAVAALAIATGLAYEAVLPSFAALIERQQTSGISRIVAWLESRRFKCMLRSGAQPAFAPSHIAKVLWECPHYVAVDAHGRVFDPYPLYEGYSGGHDSLDHPDFSEVFWTLGIWPA